MTIRKIGPDSRTVPEVDKANMDDIFSSLIGAKSHEDQQASFPPQRAADIGGAPPKNRNPDPPGNSNQAWLDVYNDRLRRMQQAQDSALKQHYQDELDVIKKTLDAMGISPQGGPTPSTGQPTPPGGPTPSTGQPTPPGGPTPSTGQPTPPGGPSGPNSYDDIINAASKKYGVSPDLIKAVIQQESNWDPNAVSPANAQGLMQVKPETAADIGGGGANLFDPATNIDLGTKYLRQMLDLAGGDEAAALVKYNAGPNADALTIPAGQDHSAETYATKVLSNLS